MKFIGSFLIPPWLLNISFFFFLLSRITCQKCKKIPLNCRFLIIFAKSINWHKNRRSNAIKRDVKNTKVLATGKRAFRVFEDDEFSEKESQRNENKRTRKNEETGRKTVYTQRRVVHLRGLLARALIPTSTLHRNAEILACGIFLR